MLHTLKFMIWMVLTAFDLVLLFLMIDGWFKREQTPTWVYAFVSIMFTAWVAMGHFWNLFSTPFGV